MDFNAFDKDAKLCFRFGASKEDAGKIVILEVMPEASVLGFDVKVDDHIFSIDDNEVSDRPTVAGYIANLFTAGSTGLPLMIKLKREQESLAKRRRVETTAPKAWVDPDA